MVTEWVFEHHALHCHIRMKQREFVCTERPPKQNYTYIDRPVMTHQIDIPGAAGGAGVSSSSSEELSSSELSSAGGGVGGLGGGVGAFFFFLAFLAGATGAAAPFFTAAPLA